MITASDARLKLEKTIEAREKRIAEWAVNQLPMVEKEILSAINNTRDVAYVTLYVKVDYSCDSPGSYADALQKLLTDYKYAVAYTTTKDGYYYTIEFGEKKVYR